PPAERLGEAVSGDLALVETGREVPERPLAALGFVDGERRFPGERQLGEQGDVAGRWHPALDGDGAPAQELKRVGRHGRCCGDRRGRPDPWAGCTPGRWAGRPARGRAPAPRTPPPGRA